MNSAVCTLFEGNYHYGVAALANSLYKNGFRGEIYAGYRGVLPEWAMHATEQVSTAWINSKVLSVTEGLDIVFLPVETDIHFTNYKPDFILKILAELHKPADSIFYFDPDIVVKCEWDFFKYWVSCGVAVVHEIMYNDMPSTHPIRNKWELIIKKSGKQVARQLSSYVNGGFCGIKNSDITFLEYWSEFINTSFGDFNADLRKMSDFTKTHPFCFIDQDSLNIALMCYPGKISEIGPDGMDFIHGGYIMSHAAGSLKPWKKPFFLCALKGILPSRSDKEYWKNVKGPLILYGGNKIFVKRFMIAIASFIGRFYTKK